MKLVSEKYCLNIPIEETVVNVICIENKDILSGFVRDVLSQIDGNYSEFIVEENEKNINFAKYVECITSPFLLDINNKKIITKLYKEINENAVDNLTDKTVEINSMILNYLDNLICNQTYPLEYEVDINVIDILKMYNVRIAVEETTLAENMLNYIKFMKRICGLKVFFLINIKQYFKQEELLCIYKECLYEKINIILVESSYNDSYDYEKIWIIDKDLCIIEP